MSVRGAVAPLLPQLPSRASLGLVSSTSLLPKPISSGNGQCRVGREGGRSSCWGQSPRLTPCGNESQGHHCAVSRWGHRALAAALPKPLVQRRSRLLSTLRPTPFPSPGLGAAGTLPAWESAPRPSRLLSKILSECEDADEIEYLEDGSWCPIRAEKERSCSPQCSILVLGESRRCECGLPRPRALRPSPASVPPP